MTGTVVDFQHERNLPTMFFAQAARLGNKPFLWGKGDGGAFTAVTWAAAAAQVRDLARGLRALAIRSRWSRKIARNGFSPIWR